MYHEKLGPPDGNRTCYLLIATKCVCVCGGGKGMEQFTLKSIQIRLISDRSRFALRNVHTRLHPSQIRLDRSQTRLDRSQTRLHPSQTCLDHLKLV